jgi:hypothetical protein
MHTHTLVTLRSELHLAERRKAARATAAAARQSRRPNAAVARSLAGLVSGWRRDRGRGGPALQEACTLPLQHSSVAVWAERNGGGRDYGVRAIGAGGGGGGEVGGGGGYGGGEGEGEHQHLPPAGTTEALPSPAATATLPLAAAAAALAAGTAAGEGPLGGNGREAEEEEEALAGGSGRAAALESEGCDSLSPWSNGIHADVEAAGGPLCSSAAEGGNELEGHGETHTDLEAAVKGRKGSGEAEGAPIATAPLRTPAASGARDELSAVAAASFQADKPAAPFATDTATDTADPAGAALGVRLEPGAETETGRVGAETLGAGAAASVGAHENRLSNLLQSLMLAGTLALTPVIRLIPTSILWGYFAYMAAASLPGNDMWERMVLLIQDPSCWAR